MNTKICAFAPATIGNGTPSPLPTPINATPTVPAVVQELPVDNETTLHIKQAASKKIDGFRKVKP